MHTVIHKFGYFEEINLVNIEKIIHDPYLSPKPNVMKILFTKEIGLGVHQNRFLVDDVIIVISQQYLKKIMSFFDDFTYGLSVLHRFFDTKS